MSSTCSALTILPSYSAVQNAAMSAVVDHAAVADAEHGQVERVRARAREIEVTGRQVRRHGVGADEAGAGEPGALHDEFVHQVVI